MRAVALAALLAASVASAQPLGPDTRLRGFDREQSRMVYAEGKRLLDGAQQRFGKGLGISALSGRALTCGLAQMMQGVIEAAAFHQGSKLNATQVAGARQAVAHLLEIQARNCDRPKGGGMGTGNEGDRLVQAFFNAHAPRARSALEEVRATLGRLFSPESARIARDALLAASLVAAGLVLAPLWAT